MTPRLTKKLKATLQQRAIEGAIRSIMALNPQYDRPSTVDIMLSIRPKNEVKFLHIRQSYQIP